MFAVHPPRAVMYSHLDWRRGGVGYKRLSHSACLQLPNGLWRLKNKMFWSFGTRTGSKDSSIIISVFWDTVSWHAPSRSCGGPSVPCQGVWNLSWKHWGVIDAKSWYSFCLILPFSSNPIQNAVLSVKSYLIPQPGEHHFSHLSFRYPCCASPRRVWCAVWIVFWCESELH